MLCASTPEGATLSGSNQWDPALFPTLRQQPPTASFLLRDEPCTTGPVRNPGSAGRTSCSLLTNHLSHCELHGDRTPVHFVTLLSGPGWWVFVK